MLAKGLLNPSVARGLIESATGGDVVTDTGLSPAKLLEFAGVLARRRAGRHPDVPDRGGRPRTISGASVLEPRIDGDNMQAVLAMFRGETSLAEAPEQVFDPTTPAPSSATAAPDAGTRRRPTAPPTTAAPPTGPAENAFGIVPPRDVEC